VAISLSAFAPAGPQLLSLATALPDHVFEQRQAADMARATFGNRIAGYEALARVFASTGIEHRYSVEPPAWFEEPHAWPDRTASYVSGASKLFEDVVRKSLASAGLEAGDIDAVVTVSSTGIATPSLEAHVLPRLGFRPDVRRIPIFGLGCAGGVSGFANAARIAAAEPGTTVLLVAIELCTLAFRSDRATKMDIISAALFGDGAAAAIFRCGDGPALGRVGRATEHLWANTLDIMGWSTDQAGLGVILSRSLPGFIAQHYRVEFDRAMERLALTPSDVDRVVCHPGGPKVLEAIEAALELPEGTLGIERSVMRDFGNMSSPTVLFVLERTLAQGFAGTAVLATLGPGFTASFATLYVADR
jgi:alkylresorcinol/alkylpyrone synthase